MTATTGTGDRPVVPTAADKPAARKTTLPETTEGHPWPSNHEIKKESNPFTDRDWRMLVYAWFGLLVRLIIVFGALFSVYQFLAAREEKRVERSLALVELWETPDYQAAQRAVKTRLADLNAKYASLLPKNPSATERAVYVERIGIEALNETGGSMPLPEFQDQFDRIVYFLNRMAFCVDGDLCSADVVDAYFRDYAVSFWGYFSGYVEKQRRAGTSNYAKPIEAYVVNGVQTAAP